MTKRFWVGVLVGVALATGVGTVAVPVVTSNLPCEPRPEIVPDCEELTGCPYCVCWNGPTD